jgi:hypothetical protein
MYSIYYAYHVAIFAHHPYQMMMIFKNLDFSHIKDIDLHNLAVKKASSLLLMRLKYFYQITCNSIYVVSLLHLKAKGFHFIIHMKLWFHSEWLLP